jgi:hypothetical protein
MKGHIQRRGKNSFRLKYEGERDPITGKRTIYYKTVRGGVREAQNKLNELTATVASGNHVAPKRLSVGEHVKARIDHWEAIGDISARTAERYRELLTNQIVPHIGSKLLQKLKPFDVETWYAMLKTSGRKDGNGGISNRTIGHAHRVLGKALKDAGRHELIARNPTANVSAPKVEQREMKILDDGQVKPLSRACAGAPCIRRRSRCSLADCDGANCWRCGGAMSISQAR